MNKIGLAVAASLVAIGGIGACSSSSSDHPPAPTSDAGATGTSCTESTTGTPGALASFTPPADPGSGGILFAASGEVLALTGYPFPPVNPGDPVFVDGWDVHFTRLLTTVDKIRLSNDPDLSPGDPSQTGSLVAEVDGPWAVDLAHGDPNYLQGKGGPGEEAAPIAALKNQNRVSGTPGFATDGTRYALSLIHI